MLRDLTGLGEGPNAGEMALKKDYRQTFEKFRVLLSIQEAPEFEPTCYMSEPFLVSGDVPSFCLPN